ncbi:MAG: diadenylate cyclase CdaA [Bacillota bacterium]|jgi:diadenylate cyclase|nr:diadenylate cyclase CdaA [Bacillota bacterium]NLM08574.1 TIGR00159 family protein [Clostridiales Family XIII bacterium]
MAEVLTNMFASFSVTDVIDVAIVTFVVYKVMTFIRETRAEQLVKGLLILVAATFLSDVLNLYTLNWLLEGTLTLGVIALIIVFQPELRRGLEYIGRSKFIRKQFGEMNKEKAKTITSTIIKAIDYFSVNKIGALLIIERETTLNDIIETGTEMDALVTERLLETVFYPGGPLHDGACIIRGDRAMAAGCVLPLTQNRSLSKDLGTRHRAGLGITENSDAIALIVSEETGIISIAIDGKLSRFLDIKTVEKTLLNLYLSQMANDDVKNFISKLFRRKGGGDEGQ